VRERVVADLSLLPLHGRASASVTWWGTLAFMLIEGTGFALVLAIYLYLADIATEWPLGAPPPDLGPGSGTSVILIASLVPNYLILRWTAQQQLTRVRIGLVVMVLFGIAPLVVRVFEFPALHVNWDSNAYGSITWTLLGLHLMHVIILSIEDGLMMTYVWSKGLDDKHARDIRVTAVYWYWVVAVWLVLYVVIYWSPRFL